MYAFTSSRHVFYVSVDSGGFMKLHQLLAYDISPIRPLLAAGVSSLLSDGCAARQISLTGNLRQQTRSLAFNRNTLTDCLNILRSQ